MPKKEENRRNKKKDYYQQKQFLTNFNNFNSNFNNNPVSSFSQSAGPLSTPTSKRHINDSPLFPRKFLGLILNNIV
jgi:hypothetical protein